MMNARSGAAIALALLMLAGCGKKDDKTAAAAVPTINDSMTKVMEPTAQTIWDTVSKAYNDRGDAIDPAKLSPADWQALADATAKMRDRAEIIANAPHIIVAAANEPILGSQAAGDKGKIGADWDAASAEQVQARIDAKHDLFAQKAHDLFIAAQAMNKAATSKDAVALYKVASQLDETCDACHEPFWGTDEPPPFPKN